MKKMAVAVIACGHGENGTIGSQTKVNLDQGLSIWGFLTGYGNPSELICSGMALIPARNPPVTQEDLMKDYLKEKGISNGIFAEKTKDNLKLYNKSWGNAIEIVDVAIAMDIGEVYVVDQAVHLPRLKLALWYVARLAHYNLRVVGNPAELNASNQAQWVVKSTLRFWLYERAVTILEIIWLLSHRSQIRKHYKK
jgi:hypothetical protein